MSTVVVNCKLLLQRYHIFNFMLVGGIGYVLNLAVYWLLLPVAQKLTAASWYYIPPFVISALVAITSNYLLNKHWTFRGKEEAAGGMLRYYTMAGVTWLADVGLLALFVSWLKFGPQVAAAVAILVVFVARYSIARRWIWKEQSKLVSKEQA